MIRTVLGNWITEARPDGIYVLVEEIGGQGELGPYPDAEAARAGLLAYLKGDHDAAPRTRPMLPRPRGEEDGP